MEITVKYTITNETVMVILDGKTISVRRGEPNFIALRDAALRGDEAAVRAAKNAAGAVSAWSRGRFVIDGEAVKHDGMEVPSKFGKRLRAMAARSEDVDFLLRFFERLSKNPSRRSVEQLYDFLEHEHVPILRDGAFLAYKGVTSDYLDVHTKTFDNRPGSVNTMARELVNDDPDKHCSAGFHVGSLEYAKWFLGQECPDGHVVICRVAPEDVVSVPRDHSARKVRVWRYEVIGEWSGEPLSSTTHIEQLPAKVDRVSDAMHAAMMSMTPAQLMRLTAEDLRDFMRQQLRLVGAVPGGSKAELVGKIVSMRKGRGR